MTALTLIETGGTICMQAGPLGLVPAAGQVEAALHRLAPGLAIDVQAIAPLIDSAEVGPALWNDLIARVRAAPGPVIITHGTDTMAHTGAALEAALAGLDRVVVLCGAMRPLEDAQSDAPANLALALQAAQTAGPGLWLAFAGKLLAAGRLTKAQSQSADAFIPAGDPAPPAPPPARRFDPGLAIGVVTLSPGLSPRALAAALGGLDGAVLRVFGAGTGPRALAPVLGAAVARGCRIVAVSQCAEGGLTPGSYAAGAGLWAAGVENGGLQSVEQALARLWLRLSARTD